MLTAGCGSVVLRPRAHSYCRNCIGGCAGVQFGGPGPEWVRVGVRSWQKLAEAGQYRVKARGGKGHRIEEKRRGRSNF
jgi:hypothetical protein